MGVVVGEFFASVVISFIDADEENRVAYHTRGDRFFICDFLEEVAHDPLICVGFEEGAVAVGRLHSEVHFTYYGRNFAWEALEEGLEDAVLGGGTVCCVELVEATAGWVKIGVVEVVGDLRGG